MHRIDTSTAQKDKFGAGKNGFTLGNAQTGVPPTEVSADILDAMQEEICAVIEDPDSGINLDKSKNNQLITAIKKIMRSIGMSASENARGTIKIASQTQVESGQDDDASVTPKKLRAGFAVSLSQSSGYVAFPSWLGGFIFQYGTFAVSSLNAYPASPTADKITFPIAFTNYCGVVSGDFTSGIGNGWLIKTLELQTITNFTLRASSSSAMSGLIFKWFAFGK